jgi:hypothetical protein
MRDEFAASRLPDLPNDGYSTRREKALSDEVMFYLRDTERDRLQLVSTVCGGREKFRRVVKKAWRHLKCDDEMADAVFGYLVLLAGPNPELQLEELKKLEDRRQNGSLWMPTN